MSGPVPSPSMNGMMGSSGTCEPAVAEGDGVSGGRGHEFREEIGLGMDAGHRDTILRRAESVPGHGSTLNLTGSSRDRQPGRGHAARAVAAIHAAYDEFLVGFQEITRRARERFEQRDWLGAQADATERLALYRVHLDAAVADSRDILQDAVMERTLWAAMKSLHAPGTARTARRRDRADVLQFGDPARLRDRGRGRRHRVPRAGRARRRTPASAPPLYDTLRGSHRGRGADTRDPRLRFPGRYPTPSRSATSAIVAELIRAALREVPATGPVAIDVVRSVFYRNKGAYVVGRVRAEG